MEFEWDENKNKINIVKHNISFVAAGRVLRKNDNFIKQSSHNSEERFVAIGPYENRYISIIYTMRGSKCRIISARAARKNERKEYEQAKGKNR